MMLIRKRVKPAMIEIEDYSVAVVAPACLVSSMLNKVSENHRQVESRRNDKCGRKRWYEMSKEIKEKAGIRVAPETKSGDRHIG